MILNLLSLKKKEQKPECIHSEELYDKNHITIKEFLKQIN